MQQSTDTSQLTTDAPQVTVLDTLRSVGIPTETQRVTSRDVPQHRTLTATTAEWPTDADVDHALGAYGNPDRYDRPAAYDAFGAA